MILLSKIKRLIIATNNNETILTKLLYKTIFIKIGKLKTIKITKIT